MTEASAQDSSLHPPPAPAPVADVMPPPATTLEQNDHVAAAAYLMKHADATALVVLGGERTNGPMGIITEADIVQAVADGKNVNDDASAARGLPGHPWSARPPATECS